MQRFLAVAENQNIDLERSASAALRVIGGGVPIRAPPVCKETGGCKAAITM
jgi:hypothetical protein